MEIHENAKVETIKAYFDEREWNYEIEFKNDTYSIFTCFDGTHETLTFRINIHADTDIYNIACRPDRIIPVDCLEKAKSVVNDFNLGSLLICSCIASKGNIIFYISRQLKNQTFTQETFEDDFERLFRIADNESAHIYMRSVNPEVKKKGLLARLIKQQ